MEANEAPEKIYLNWVNYPLEEMQVEYVRKDAFIEKAVIWISNNCYIPHSTLENFKNYMKGEEV